MHKRQLSANFKARYEIIDELVNDPSGALVLARDGQSSREVAIKFIASSKQADSNAPLFAQAKILAAIDHPHIVRVTDASSTDSHPYVAFEHVEGDQLSVILNGLGALPLKLALAWAKQLTRALQCAHGHELLHGDLTSDTVLVASNETIKVTDFGLVRRSEHRSHFTATGVIQGTPAYMAPELALGEKPSRATDIYATGVILFEMLTASLPFAGSTAADMLLAHVRVPAPNPSSMRPGVPTGLSAVILKAMAKQPEERHESFDSFYEALAALTVEEDEIGRRATLLRKRNASPDDSGERDPEARRSTRRMLAVSFSSGPDSDQRSDPEEDRPTARLRPPAAVTGPPDWEGTVRIRATSTKAVISWQTRSQRSFAYSVAHATTNQVFDSGDEPSASDEHSIEVTNLEPGTTFVIRIWDERDYLKRRFKTPVAAL